MKVRAPIKANHDCSDVAPVLPIIHMNAKQSNKSDSFHKRINECLKHLTAYKMVGQSTTLQ